MSLTPPSGDLTPPTALPVRLVNISKFVAKASIVVAPGDELEVPADVAAQIEEQRLPLKPKAAPAKRAPKGKPKAKPAADG